MRCPRCGLKLSKDTEICPECKLRLPPPLTLWERITYLLHKIIELAVIAGLCVLIYQLAQPDNNKEPVHTYGNEVQIDSNVGVVMFKDAGAEYIDNITSSVKELNLQGTCHVSYKYNTDEHNYKNNITALINENKCEDIIITSKAHYNTLLEIAPQYKEVDFYVLWGSDSFNDALTNNIQICRLELERAIYSVGVNSAHYITEKIKSMDVTSPEYSNTNYYILYLYKSEESKKYYDQFLKGVKNINPNLSTYDYYVEDEAEYAKLIAESNDLFGVMLADEMPEFTNKLSELKPDNTYLSGSTTNVKNYSNYLCTIRTDYNKYINYIFSHIESGETTGKIHNGNYEDNFCRIDYNKSIIGILK